MTYGRFKKLVVEIKIKLTLFIKLKLDYMNVLVKK